jgi:PBSX family phage terminase large subunit
MPTGNPSLRTMLGLTLPASEAPPTAYTPHGGAEALLYCHDDEVLLEGPSNTGKSRSALEKLYLCAALYPGMRGLIIRKTRESCTESVLVTWERKVLPPGSPIAAGPDRNHRQRYTFPNGSEIVVGGIDKPGKIMSTEYDLIYVPEATELTENDWESLTTRARNKVMPYNQLIADCNPGSPQHWLNQRCLTGQTTRLLSRHADNPTVTDADLRKLQALTGARRARLYEGRWAAQEGLVYAFDPAIHCVTDADLAARGLRRWPPAGWRRTFYACDWGYTNPGCLQVWGQDGDGRLCLLWEVYQTGQTIEWWVAQAQIARDVGGATEGPCDPSEPAFIAAFERAKLHPVAAQNDLTAGLQTVTARLRVASDGRPRLQLAYDALTARDPVLQESHRPTGTREEFDGYVWPRAADGHELKEAPVKKDDHGLDTLRYAVMFVDAPARSRRLIAW